MAWKHPFLHSIQRRKKKKNVGDRSQIDCVELGNRLSIAFSFLKLVSVEPRAGRIQAMPSAVSLGEVIAAAGQPVKRCPKGGASATVMHGPRLLARFARACCDREQSTFTWKNAHLQPQIYVAPHGFLEEGLTRSCAQSHKGYGISEEQNNILLVRDRVRVIRDLLH